MALPNHRLWVLTLLALLRVEPVMATVGDAVDGRIEGVILEDGKPVQGVRIWSCRDRRPAGNEKTCDEMAGTWTNESGRFSFTMRTGYRPPRIEDCQKPFSCHGDPGWAYWFVVEAVTKTATFWNGGLGYGRTYAQVSCDLGKLRRQPPRAELECDIVREDWLKYGQ
jgi:hypothetical protein